MQDILTINFCASRYRRLLVVLILAGVAMPLLGVSGYAQQDPYFDPSLGVGDSIIRSDVFVADKQGRVTATEGLFTKQMSGWLSGDEVLMGEVVHVGRGCIGDTYLNDPAGKLALIERGVCTFVEKITRASNAGAIGAIVYNSVAGDDFLIRMGPIASPELVPIPGFFVARSSGLTLAATPATVKIQAASFRALKDGVTALLNSGILNRQQAGSLKDKISAASDAADAGDFATAVSLMQQFEAEITSLYNGGAGVLPQADFNALQGAADTIIVRLESPYTGFMP